EAGFRVGSGYSTRRDIQVIPFYAHSGWLFPDVIDEPLARHGFDLEYVVEGWIGGVTGPQNAIEVGVNPVGFKISYDVGQTVVPYVGGALGAPCTGLQGVELGGPSQFSETVGLGVAIFVERGVAVTVGYRYRHVSN